MKKILLFLMALSFTFLGKAQTLSTAKVKDLVAKNKATIGMSDKDLQHYIVNHAYSNEGFDYVYLLQEYKGLPVFNQMRVLAFKNGTVISNAGGFITDITANSSTASVNANAAVNAAFREAKLAVPTLSGSPAATENGRVLNYGKTTQTIEDVKAELLWIPVDANGKTFVRLAWQVQVASAVTPDFWLINVDANSGDIVSKLNLNVSDRFEKGNTIGAGLLKARNVAAAGFNANTLGTAAASAASSQKTYSPDLVGTVNYLVVPFPAESPKHPGGTAAVRTNPWTAAPGNATSLKWHNDGTTDYTISRGNDTWATEDRAGTNGNTTITPTGLPATSTTSPDPLNFQFTPDYTVDPTTALFQQFAITNLFYWNNILHDISYQYSFNEVARNFQASNQGRGGAQGDYVIAIAQSASGTNNANFATPADGSRPRMRMYLFDPVSSTTLHVNAPASTVGDYGAIEGNFSTANQLSAVGPVTGNTVRWTDGLGSHEACGVGNAPATSVAGKIVLIDRGNCNFTEKIKNAQDAGAIAVIMIQIATGTGAPNPIIMGGSDNTITIPAVMVSVSTGATLVAQVGNGLNITLSATTSPNIDGDLDASVFCHEFMHGISNRMTGNGFSCLGNAEEGGEGWADYNGLMFTTNWATATTADGPIPRPIGNYVVFNAATGPGIRNYPYSTNIVTNPLTYANMGTGVIGTEVHNIGEIWCMAIWEMTWAIIQQQNAIDPNLYNYTPTNTGGNVISYKLVLEGFKLQPCSPGYIDGRNAILAADRNLYAGRHACAIWTAFAKRGMGQGSSQGSSNSATDQVSTTTMPPAPTITTQPVATVSVANGASVTLTANAGADVNLIYRWQVSTDGGATYNDVTPDVITGSYTFTATCAMNNYKFRAAVSIGCLITNTTATTLTVTGCSSAPAITLTSASGSNAQTVCVNTPITNIVYSTSGGVTGATVTGLPAGVNSVYSGGTNGTVTISGSPTAAGPFTYTVTTSGGTPAATATGTITVNPNVSITLTSAAATTSQTVPINTPITTITYSTANGATGVTVTGLPAGVTGVYSGGTFTISGTPTIAGTFNYSVSTAGGCGSSLLTGTITVNPVAAGPSITLTSAAGSNVQTVCLNTAITPITYSTAGGVTNATVTGLPAGVTGTYAGTTNGTFTISGTPTAAGTFIYTITTTGGGTPAATATGTIIVNANATITLSSAAGTNNQTLCANTAITNITYTTAGGATGVTVTGLPTGVTSSFAGSTVTISGTPSVSGTFNYVVTTTGGCGTATANGTITVNPGTSITLTSAAGTNNQTRCVNTAITTITYSTAGGVTNATVTGLPAGVTGTYSAGTNGTVTISGTPTVTGTFTYTVTTSGGCAPITATGTIIVNPNATITLSSAAGTNTQTGCSNTAITTITYTLGTGVTGATVTGLPAGVTSTVAGSAVTISGTPTATGIFNYTVTTTGGCNTASATGTLTINPSATITLTSAAGTANQSICNGAAIMNITYSIGNGGTGATVTGLPAGVTGAYAAGVFTISGTPTATGTFAYTVSTSGGGCGSATAAGTIAVNPNATITLSSAAGTNTQAACLNTAITNITYTLGAGVTGAAVTGLPAGVTSVVTGTTVTISGAPTATGTFNYTIATTGGCGTAAATGTITVNPAATITLTSAAGTTNQSACNGSAITNITYSVANGATGATATGLPAGVTGTYAGGVFTISGTPTATGTFNYTVNTTGGCGSATLTGTITTGGAPVISIQPQNITSCTTIATFSVTATGAGLSYQWQVSTNGGTTYTNIAGQTGSTLTLTGLTPAQANNRYRVVITGACGTVTSNSVTAQVGTPPVAVLTATNGGVINPANGGGLFVTVSPVGNYVYQWKKDGVIVPNVLGPVFSAANIMLYGYGAYQVTVFDVASGCSGVSNIVTVTDNENVRGHLFISPNPTRDLVHVSFFSTTTATRATMISVYDSKGARVIDKAFTASGNYSDMVLDMSKMVNGTYSIVLRDASGKQVASGNVIKF